MSATAGGAAASADAAAAPPPPPERIDHKVKFGAVEGEVRGDNAMAKPIELNDPLFWMRDDKREDPKVIGRLKLENAHSSGFMAPLAEFKDSLYAELKGHLKETDCTTPFPKGDFQYFTRTVEGLSYAIHCRQPRGKVVGADPEQVLLDENALAEANTASSFTAVGRLSVSPVSQKRLAYTVDTFGGETYDLVICDLDADPAAKVPKEVSMYIYRLV